ncbi:acetyl-CoA carboxylase biotin carboxylase subunit family protein [Streptomyces sp. NPDC059009]|uniref:ATP-grasp domain-containing protein n=1 Tax=Streptomyces sp. NPDC059009 TaxID=3346694 RepID=UPI00368D8E53
MALLLLNRRSILPDLPDWLPGESLVLVTARSALAEPIPDRLARRFHRIEVVDDLVYESGEVDRLIDALCARHDVERLLSTAEFDVVRAARARARHGLPGQSVASAVAYRDKHVMKRLAAGHGVAVPPMAPVRDTADVLSFMDTHGLPVVVKPHDGVASVGVRLLRDRREAERLELGGAGGLLAERFVDGTVCHVDGLMAGGRVLFGAASRYLYGNLDTATHGAPNISAMLADDDPLAVRLLDATAAVVAALPAVEEVTALHAEFFHTPDDDVVLCEIACRPGGCGIVEAFELSTGINLYAAHLRGQAGLPTPAAVEGERPRHGWGWFPPRRGTLVRLPSSCPLSGTVRFTAHGAVGSYSEGPTSSSDRVAELVYRLPDAGDVEDTLRAVDNWWASGARWDDG